MKITKTSAAKGKDKVKLYQAPEVLVGQNESEVSYVWTFGVLIDLIFHEKLYFEKFADILNKKGTFFQLFKESYKFYNEDAQDIGAIVEKMVIKDKARRITLDEAYESVLSLVS